MKNLVRTYNKLKKSFLLIIAVVFFLSSFAGKLQNCICEDTIEVITEETVVIQKQRQRIHVMKNITVVTVTHAPLLNKR